MSRDAKAKGRRERPRLRHLNGHALPNSPEAEQALLSCCMLDGADVIGRAIDAGIKPETFFDARHGIIYAALAKAFREQKPIADGVAVVAEELRAQGDLQRIGGYDFLLHVTDRVPTTAQAGYFLDTVRRLALRRARIRAAVSVAESEHANDADAVTRACAELREMETEERGILPPVVSADQLESRKAARPPELVAGVLHKGRRMIVAGGSKSFKTWVLLDLAASIASGTPWWGMRTTPGPVLFVNFELADWAIDERLAEVCAAKKISRPPNLHLWNLDGYGMDIDELLPHFEARGIRGQYAGIILDPIYVCLGERDENSNSDVTQLMNRLARLARMTRAAVVFGHHFSKGNQADKDARDRASGAGAWVRAPDTVLTLTAHEEEGAFRVDYVLRNFAQKAASVVRWKHPCMEVAPGLDPAALKGPGRTREFGVGDVCEALADGGLTFSQWAKAVGVGRRDRPSESTFKRLRSAAIDAGRVKQVGTVYMLVVGDARANEGPKGPETTP